LLLNQKFIIESVVFRLSKEQPNIPDYPLVAETVAMTDLPLLQAIRLAIQKIRASKLPDLKKIANVGSFFKNIFVDEEIYKKLFLTYPDIPNFKSENKYKIPAGWLIEKAGFKGYTQNGVGVYEKNALVLVNISANKTHELLSLAKKIQDDVKEKFGLQLEIEPEVI
jgi:UDP-N-acetylmuramate dehydrogenase